MMWGLLLSMIYRESKINKKEWLRGLEEWESWKTTDSTGEKVYHANYLEDGNPGR